MSLLCPVPCWFLQTLKGHKSLTKTFNEIGLKKCVWENYLSDNVKSSLKIALKMLGNIPCYDTRVKVWYDVKLNSMGEFTCNHMKR